MLIAQITDTHIVGKDEHWLFPSTKTSERLEKVVSYLNQMSPQPDVILFTGDATDSGTPQAYQHLKQLLKPLRAPLFVIPGNHDNREEMRKAFSENSYLPKKGFLNYIIKDYPVNLVGLDTLVKGKDFGQVSEESFAWLTEHLHEINEKPFLLFMHHPLTMTGKKLFDSMTCLVPTNFEKVIKAQNNLLAILTGHYHHLCITSYGGKICLMAPSVSPVHYIANAQDDFVTAIELEDPAITLHQWFGENKLTTHVIKIKEHYPRIRWPSYESKFDS